MVDATENLDQLTVNTLRTLCMDAVQKANSGHPGAPMGLAPAAYVLFKKCLKYNPKNPAWIDRDRFVLSGGHVSSLLYSLLYLFGYGLTLDDLKNFRQWGSRTPGHPEYGETPGVETTTGPLGQGIANAWAWPLPNPIWRPVSTRQMPLSSITIPSACAGTGTSWKGWPWKRCLWPVTWAWAN